MAVAYDTSAGSTFGHDNGPGFGGVTSATAAFTGASGASLVVDVTAALIASAGSTAPWTLDVTYNSVPMLSLARKAPPVSTTSFIETFGLLNCCDGSAHNIVMTMTPNGGGASGGFIMGRVSATGVDHFDTPVTNNSSSSASPALSVPSAAGDFVVAAGAHGDVISGQNQTQRWLLQVANNNTAGSNMAGQTAAGAASVSCTWTSSLTDSWAVIGVNLAANPAVVAAGLLRSMAGDGLRAMDDSRLVPMTGPPSPRPSAIRRIRRTPPPPPRRGSYPR